MTIHVVLGFVSGGLSLFAYCLYIYSIWWGNTRPSRSSWWILTVVWGVLFASSLSLGGENDWVAYVERAIQLTYVIGSLAIAISTIWRGQNEQWGLTGWLCAGAAGIALVLYFIGQDYLILSLAMSTLADFFGIWPTIQNARKYPENEHLLAWEIEVTASIIALGAISVWALSWGSAGAYLPVFYLIAINGAITFLIRSGLRRQALTT